MRQLAFYFAIYKDEPLALRLARQIRLHYPNAEIVAITDGEHGSSELQSIKNYGVIFVEGNHLKKWGCGGAGAHRNLAAALEFTQADTLIQMDPDAYLWRRFQQIPDQPWFGQVHISQCTWYPHSPMPCVHGGTWGMKREFARLALKSELLLDPLYSTSKTLWAYKLKRDNKRLLPRFDLIWGHVAADLGVQPSTWADVNGGLLAGDKVGGWAATHPVL